MGEDENQFHVLNRLGDWGEKLVTYQSKYFNITDYPARALKDTFMLELIRRFILFL